MKAAGELLSHPVAYRAAVAAGDTALARIWLASSSTTASTPGDVIARCRTRRNRLSTAGIR
jgi:hypothetical protein